MKINFCEVIIKVKIFIRHKYIIVDFFSSWFLLQKETNCYYYCYIFCCCLLLLLLILLIFLLIYILRLLLLLLFLLLLLVFVSWFWFFFDYLLGFWLGVCWSYNFWIFPAPNFQNPCCSHWLFKAFSHFSSWSRFVFRHIRRRRRRFGVGDLWNNFGAKIKFWGYFSWE